MIMLLLLNAPLQANAKDFATHGHVFTIFERDILEVINEQLQSKDLDALNKKMQTTTKNYVENPTEVKGITNYKKQRNNHNNGKITDASLPEVFYYDPTYTLDRDIFDAKGSLLHKSGKKVNPLEYIPLRENLLFINGDDQRQVALATALHHKKWKKEQKNKKNEQNRQNQKAYNDIKDIKIILTKGSPLKIQREHKIWIYFDQAGILTSKLGIKQVPALVEQDGLRLKITHIDPAGVF